MHEKKHIFNYKMAEKFQKNKKSDFFSDNKKKETNIKTIEYFN